MYHTSYCDRVQNYHQTFKNRKLIIFLILSRLVSTEGLTKR